MSVSVPSRFGSDQPVLLAGRYELGECIGRGGMADVYEARDQVLGRNVAVKVLAEHSARDPRTAERFKREAQAVATVTHPNIVAIYDCGLDDATPFLVMERIRGTDLRDRLREQGPLPEKEALEIGAKIAAALAAAHEKGVVHRDIKPGNVLLDEDGRVKVADFGIAHSMDRDVTQTTAVMGTATYMAPEQVEGKRPDGRADLYSLGVLLYELLTGKPPFEAESAMAVALHHVRTPPPDPSIARPDLSEAALSVVRRALQKEPGRRFENATEMQLVLESAARGEPIRVADGDVAPTRVAAAETARLVMPPRNFRRREETSRRFPAVSLPRWRGGRVSPGLLLAGALVALFLVATVWAISASSNGGLFNRGVEVPAVAGLTVAEARAAMDRAGLKIETRNERTLDTPAGLVVRYEPKEGQRAESGSTVQMVVSEGVEVPSLVGQQCAQARQALESRGWKVTAVRWRFANEPDFGKIVAQTPASGAAQAQKGTISVEVAGPVRPC